MGGTVWTKFYWSDWLSDPGLRRCTIAARGLWIDLLCYMAQHDPIGMLAVQGEALSISDVARMTGISETDASTLLGELERNGVFSRDRNGKVYSRRMVRDAKVTAEARKNGKKGGNPSLGKDRDNSAGVNHPYNPGLNGEVKTHKPVTSNQNSSTAREGTPITGMHRALALDLLDRGKDQITPSDRTFLESVCKKHQLTERMSQWLNDIATKIGFNASEAEATWRHRLELGRTRKQWDVKWGPLPGKLGCVVPDQFLQKGDGEGWTIWKPGDPINTPSSMGGSGHPHEPQPRPAAAPARAIAAGSGGARSDPRRFPPSRPQPDVVSHMKHPEARP